MRQEWTPRRGRGRAGREPAAPLTVPQHAAMASPHVSTGQPAGSFTDFERLLAQLREPVVIELGKPQPAVRHLPTKRAGACPAAHNKALLGD